MKWLVLLICVGVAHAADVAESRIMIELRYVDQDAGDPPYLTRILVTQDLMRMDGGEDDGDFILLDRRHPKLFNVMRGNKLAMVFTPGTLPPKPAGWKPKLDTYQDVQGTQRFSLTLNGLMCNEGVAATRTTPDAARAMAELKSVLAATQYRVWQASPRETQHDCDLANQVWDFNATLALGLPLDERDFRGRTRRFESESKPLLKPELFRVPDDMRLTDSPS